MRGMTPLIRLVACAVATAVLSAQTPPPEKPVYFDQPTFIASGVADLANRGGHGSDPMLRSSEALLKAVTALGWSGPGAATAQALRDALSRDPRNAALHHALAEADEKDGNYLEALREYQRAAELAPSEPHLFDLGAELLVHRAAEQSTEVLRRGVRAFPTSTRMVLALAVACYSGGLYEEATQRFFEAIDRDPTNPAPYLFLGKVQGSAVQSDGFAARMERFAALHPENAWANYYYAASLRRRAPADRAARSRSQTLLEKAVRLDPKLGAAWLELGILFAERNDYAKAISTWQSAVVNGAEMEELHYRLAQAYRKTGEPAKAKAEIERYEQLSRQSAEQLERDRAAIKQFVFGLR